MMIYQGFNYVLCVVLLSLLSFPPCKGRGSFKFFPLPSDLPYVLPIVQLLVRKVFFLG